MSSAATVRSRSTSCVCRRSARSPPWFEEAEGGTVDFGASELMQAPPGTEGSPLGAKDGLLGWKAIKRRDGSYVGQGIDGRHWDKPLMRPDGVPGQLAGLLRQPGT